MLIKKVFKILLILVFVFTIRHSVFADQATDLQNQINNTNKQIEQINAEIKKYEGQIATTSKQSASLKNIIFELNATRNKLLKEKELIEKKIVLANSAIKIISNDINTQENNISFSKKALRSLISHVYYADKVTFIERFIQNKSLSIFSRDYNAMLYLNDSIHKHIFGIKEKVKILDISKDKKEIEQQNLNLLKKNLVEKTLAVEISKKEKDTLLTETKNQESNYKKILAERLKQRDAFESSLQKYESQLKFVLNPKSLPSDGSGVLSWPLDTVYITQLFGRTNAAKRLYVSGSHSGVDFRASIGTAVKSMADGTVVGTGDTDTYCKGASFGKWIFIKYNNGLSSTFGHLSSINVNAGDKVKTGDTVALSGNTGHSTGPHLHVTVYASDGADVRTVPSLSCAGKTFTMPIAAKDAYLDPMLYLPKMTTGILKDDVKRD